MICKPCQAGQHPHDRYVGSGADGGCPNLAVPGDLTSGCTCHVVLSPDPQARRHCPTCTCGTKS